MANEYVSASTFKTQQGITVTTWDTFLASACTAASRAVESFCNRRFWADSDASSVRYYSGRPGSAVLSIDDLVTLTTLLTDTGGDGTFGTTLTNNTDFVLEPLNAAAETPARPYTLIRIKPRASSAYFPTDPRSVKVTGKFGWAAVPEEVVQAASILVNILFKRKDAPFGIATAGVDEQTAMRIAQTDPTIRALLGPFVRLDI